MAFAQRLLERRMQLVRRNLALFEIQRHQLLVDLDHLVDQRTVRVGNGREIGFAIGIEEAVDDLLSAPGGQVDRQALLAERRLDCSQHLRQVDIFGVDLVDDDEAAQLALGRPIHHSRRDHLESRLRAYDNRRRLHGVERADRLPDEIGEARRVDQVDPRVLGIDVHDRRAQ